MKKPYVLIAILTMLLLVTACPGPDNDDSPDPTIEYPTASFSYKCDDCRIGDTVQFTSSSSKAETFDWDFGDGNSSQEENPEHVYTVMGTYTVQLTVSNEDGSDDLSKSVSIKGPPGLLVDAVVYSPGLEGNLLGDSPYRNVTIYLPPGYESSAKRYPVVYLLHGFYGDNTCSFGTGLCNNRYPKINLEPVLEDLINAGTIEPMIVVAPDARNRFEGSWYLNSASSGNWEDFIVEDVVQFVDENYRTLPSSESRGIAGFSVGGYGAVWIAMRHADVFSAVYAKGASILAFSLPELNDGLRKMYEEILAATEIDDFDQLPDNAKEHVSLSVAVIPNPSAPPFYCDYIYDYASDQLVDSTVQKCWKFDPYTSISTYEDNLLQLSAILLDCGDQEWNLTVNTTFSEGLAEIGIENTLITFEGDHGDKDIERLRDKAFPMFSEHLVHEGKK